MRAERALFIGAMWVLGVGCGSAKVELSTAGTTTAAPEPPPPPPQPVAQPVAQVAEEAVIEGDRIKVGRPIFYDTDKDEIRPESFSVLNAVANILRTHPEIVGLTVEGHTDNQGSSEYNIKLSERRANAVVRYLVGQGITTPMLAPGYGAASALCFTNDEGCRAMNRRVEFRIKRQ